jgi:hypothetical protein
MVTVDVAICRSHILEDSFTIFPILPLSCTLQYVELKFVDVRSRCPHARVLPGAPVSRLGPQDNLPAQTTSPSKCPFSPLFSLSLSLHCLFLALSLLSLSHKHVRTVSTETSPPRIPASPTPDVHISHNPNPHSTAFDERPPSSNVPGTHSAHPHAAASFIVARQIAQPCALTGWRHSTQHFSRTAADNSVWGTDIDRGGREAI